MAVVKEFFIGATHVLIHDDFFDKTEEEREARRARISKIVLDAYQAGARNGTISKDLYIEVPYGSKYDGEGNENSV